MEKQVKKPKGSFWRRRKEKKRRLELLRQQEMQRENERDAILSKAEELWQLIWPLTDFPTESYVVFDETLKRKSFPVLWQSVPSSPLT